MVYGMPILRNMGMVYTGGKPRLPVFHVCVFLSMVAVPSIIYTKYLYIRVQVSVGISFQE